MIMFHVPCPAAAPAPPGTADIQLTTSQWSKLCDETRKPIPQGAPLCAWPRPSSCKDMCAWCDASGENADESGADTQTDGNGIRHSTCAPHPQQDQQDMSTQTFIFPECMNVETMLLSLVVRNISSRAQRPHTGDSQAGAGAPKV